MQDCHSCDPGSIPGTGASRTTLVDEVVATNTAPNLDAVGTWRGPCNVDGDATLAAHGGFHGLGERWAPQEPVVVCTTRRTIVRVVLKPLVA